jgi:RNA polymerase sigma-70 factor (ECF subfamily)
VPRRQDEFERVALPHTRGLLGFARRLTGDSHTAEDLVQESLLKAWRNFDQFQPGTNVRAWLFRILVNCWYGWGRKPKVLVMPSPKSVESAHEALEISEALDQLPADQRAVIVLAVVEGLTCREIAVILDVPIGTVMSRLSRARQAMREKLGAREIATAAGWRTNMGKDSR